MLQRGYKPTRAEAALSSGQNQYGYALPMLAHPFGRQAFRPTPRMWHQPKFDGHRALTTFDQRHRVYSRKGTSICDVGSVAHILPTLQTYLPPDIALDGELYVHGVPLQDIASWIKQAQANSARLEYMVYDVVMDAPFGDRLEVLKDVVRGLNARNPQINAAATVPITDAADAWRAFPGHRALGYEGTMLRLDGVPYKAGVRSSSLLKLKDRDEAEFPILGVTEVKNGLANVILGLENGRTFETLAPGTHDEKRKYLLDESIWKGKQMTCAFPYKTKDGIPFHCIALRIREDI